MNTVSVLNDVLGPVMAGPSSSHTAAPFFIATAARRLLDEPLAGAVIAFDPGGSFAEVYKAQRSDIGFAAGLAGMEITDPDFSHALERLQESKISIQFLIERLAHNEHPNSVELRLNGVSDKQSVINAQSTGGGTFAITHIENFPVHFDGQCHAVFLVARMEHVDGLRELLKDDATLPGGIREQPLADHVVLQADRALPLTNVARDSLRSLCPSATLWQAMPVFLVKKGKPLFHSAEEMVGLAKLEGKSLGEVVLDYESSILGLPAEHITQLVLDRFAVMERSVEQGLKTEDPLKMLFPSAKRLMKADQAGRLACGGFHARASARALAVMQVSAAGGVICAAPTAGSAGVVPGVVVTLAEQLGLDRPQIAKALLAASGVGLITAYRATFAAEVAGCQVEIGSACAMAAAAVVEAAGGSPQQAIDAAAIAFQNMMGLVCDPVQGVAEIPCHVRNAAAAPSAFIHADLALGGYQNPIPLDETIDAVFRVGTMMPRELRCTALGGLAQTPTARRMLPRESA